MSNISITVEQSCSAHPRLRPGATPPRSATIRVSQQRLFELGSLWLQDNDISKFKTLEQTRHGWEKLHWQYTDYLDFSSNQIQTRANGEKLKGLSEIVGVGLGVAAVYGQFRVNLNRFRRFMAPASTKRVDFEFYSSSARFFHETKGTTYSSSVPQMRAQISQQKSQTATYVGGLPNPIAIAGSTGSIALYQHEDRASFDTTVILIDPPADGPPDARPASEADELACVLRYYQNFYSVTHINNQNPDSLILASWLRKIASQLEIGGAVPSVVPKRLYTRGRTREPEAQHSVYWGTIFDARIAHASVMANASFDEATEKIKTPVTFVGVSQDVTDLIRRAQWDDLLSYVDANATLEHREGIEIADSGILTKYLEPGEYDQASRAEFNRLKRRLRT